VRDIQGRIEGFQVRRAEVRDEDDARYIWLSTSKKEEGATSGAPIHFRNVEEARRSGVAIITEGALKADVAAHLLGDRHAFIALAGVSNFGDDFGQRLRLHIPELGRVIIAYDADAPRIREVRDGLARLEKTLRDAGLEVSALRWEEKHGKGIDDYVKSPDHREKVTSFIEESLSKQQLGMGI
jgi:hypothetical protein